MDFGTLLNSTLKLGGESRSLRFVVDGSKVVATVPADSIFFSVKDILINREYELLPGFELSRQKGIIIDAGAHVGLYTLLASVGAKTVIALEPDERMFEILSNNVGRNGLRNVVLLKSALSNENGSTRFYRRGNTQLGSIRSRKNIEPVMVDAISLERLLTESIRGPSRDVDLLKLDIEGSEFDVIQDSQDDTLDRVRRIVAEIHTEHGSVQVLKRKLETCGFSYVILKRPFSKAINKPISIEANYRIRFMVRTVNLMTELARYSDWSSLLLFASRIRDDFSSSHTSPIRTGIIDSFLD